MIGYHTALHLHNQGHAVTGLDNFNDYYEVSLKRERARLLKDQHGIDTVEADLQTINYDTVLKASVLLLRIQHCSEQEI